MDYKQLEQQLSRKMRITRLTAAGIGVLFWVAGLMSASRLESGADPANSNVYIALVGICIPLGALSCAIALSHWISCRFKTAYTGKQHITAYRGLIFNVVYVDGVEKGRILPLHAYNYVDVWLQDRVKATVHFTFSILNLAHIYFSDDTATIEL